MRDYRSQEAQRQREQQRNREIAEAARRQRISDDNARRLRDAADRRRARGQG